MRPILKSCEKNVIFKCLNKLANKFCKNKLTSKNLDVGVYKVNCLNCEKSYINETGPSLKTRKREHKNDIKNKISSGIVFHINKTDHDFDFDNAAIIFPNSNISKRHIVESSIINKHKLNCVNLNNGFVSLESNVSNFVCELLKLDT